MPPKWITAFIYTSILIVACHKVMLSSVLALQPSFSLLSKRKITLDQIPCKNLGRATFVSTSSAMMESSSSSTGKTATPATEAAVEATEEATPPPPYSLPPEFVELPRHSHKGVNKILTDTEGIIQALHKHSKTIESISMEEQLRNWSPHTDNHPIYANSYVDLGKVEVVGFDYDNTLASYTPQLLELIYDMALNRLVSERQYPEEMLSAGLQYDPYFSIRGLAVDKETGWICHLSYTHKVSVAWEGREKLPNSRIYEEYRGKRSLHPGARKKRIQPLNDLFSMAECCLIADTIQFFKDRSIPFCPKNAVTDILSTFSETHLSFDFHRIVAANPQKYFESVPHLQQVLQTLKDADKILLFVSNTPFWYVDAGMKYIIGPNWRDMWDVVITSAEKPNFYVFDSRPFREVNQETGRIEFQKVRRFEPGKVYTKGCLRELMKLMKTNDGNSDEKDENGIPRDNGTTKLATKNVLYIGDHLFTDLVDAKREYGWTTAAVTPEVGFEMDMLNRPDYALARRTISLLLNALRLTQEELGATVHRTKEDMVVLDSLERLVSKWRDRETALLGNTFGSIFSARYQPSLFAHSLRRYCDLYMSSVSSLRHYSPEHRFYPEQDARLLAHEIRDVDRECWELKDVIEINDQACGLLGQQQMGNY